MRADRVQRGDVVEVSRGGRLFPAKVEGPFDGWDGHLRITPLVPNCSYLSATPQQIVKRLDSRPRKRRRAA